MPAATRSVRFVTRSTITSPARPCGFTTRPTSSTGVAPVGVASASVDDVDRGLHAFAGGGGPHDRADRLGHAPALADDLAHVVGGDVEAQVDAAAGLVDLDHDRLGIVD